jgi:hypothetical protein
MININQHGQVSFQKNDFKFTYPWLHSHNMYDYPTRWSEPIYKEKGQTYLAPLILVRW